MKKVRNLLAFDLGASNGRAILGQFDGEKITMKELHRFENNYIEMNGVYYWDTPYLFSQLKQGLLKFKQGGYGDLDAFGIDTWGVDYGLLDKNGHLAGVPRSYRLGTQEDIDAVKEKIPADKLYGRTGIDTSLTFNTLYQLYRRKRENDCALEIADTMLLTPDLLGYLLTCVVSFPVRHFLLRESHSIAEWVEKMLTFDNYAWYVEMYIGLILISPLVNPALQRADRKGILLFSGVLVLLTALPGMTPVPILPDYWTSLYPLTYYVLGAAVRKLQPKVPFRAGSLLTVSFALGMGAVSVLSTDGGFSDGFTQGYGGFFTTVLTMLVFLTLYCVQPGKRTASALAWMAGGVFEGYILSRLLDVWVYERVYFWHSPAYYPLIFLFVTVPVFFAAVFMGKLVHWPVEKLMRTVHKRTHCRFISVR